MNKPLRYILIILTTMLAFVAQAEPLNVMVGDLTFTRPKDWKWELTPTNSIAVARFVAVSHDKKITTDVRFYLSDLDEAASEKVWRGFFVDSNKPGFVKKERISVGRRDIVYMTLNGTYAYKSEKKKPGYTWVGAVIPSEQKYVVPRILGPQAEVEAALKDFKQMIEDAIKEGEK